MAKFSDNFGAFGGDSVSGTASAKALSSGSMVNAAPVSAGAAPLPTGPVTYFLKIDGVAGNSTDAAHKGWFEIDAVQLTEYVDAGYSKAGQTIGQTHFNPVSLLLDDNAALAALLGTSASGVHLSAVEIEGVATDSKGQVATVFDLVLNDVTVAGVGHSASGGAATAAITLDYGKIGVASHIYYGASDPDSSWFVWDLASATRGGSLDLPQASGTSSPTETPIHYYLNISGVSGSTAATDAQHKGWVEISALDVAMFNAAIGGVGSGGGAGKAQFTDLTLSLQQSGTLSQLMAYVASGGHIDALEIEGVALDSKGLAHTVYDLTLNDVLVNSFATSASGSDAPFGQVTFSYGKIGLVTTPTRGAVSDFGWDILNDMAIDAASLAAPPVPTVMAPALAPTQYLIRIDGVDGDSQVSGFEGWFDLAAFSFGGNNGGTVVGGGSGAGKLNLSDISLALTSGGALAGLLAALSTGEHLPAVEIVGITTDSKGTGAVVYDLHLGNVLVSSVGNSGSVGGNAGLNASLAFGQIEIDAWSNSKASAPAYHFDWDLAANTPLDNAIVDPHSGSVPSAPPAAATYYLKIDGLVGDATDTAHKGWFTVTSLSFGGSNSGSPIAGGGSGAGRVNFGDVTITLANDASLAALLRDASLGKSLAHIEIEGIASISKTPTLVYDLALDNAYVTSVAQSGSGGGDGLAVSFTYGRIGVATIAGKTTHSFGWDVQSDSTFAYTPDAMGGAISGALQSVQPLRYFVHIDGVAGDSTDADHKGWFELDALTLGMSTAVQFIKGAGGAVGVPNFQDIGLSLSQSTALTALLAATASGKGIAAVEIEGVANGKTGPVTVYDLTLNNVHVTSVNEGASAGGGGSVQTTLSYDRIGLIVGEQGSGGSSLPQQRFGYDLTTHTVIDPGTLATPQAAKAGPAIPEATKYFIKIDGLTGDSTDAAHKGWFEVSALSLGLSHNYFQAAGGGGGAGKANFSDLALLLSGNSALAALLGESSSGKHLATVEIQGVGTDSKGVAATVYDLILRDAMVTSVATGGSTGAPAGGLSLSFAYGAIGLITSPIQHSGSQSLSFGWDLVHNEAIDPATLFAPDTTAPVVTLTAQVLDHDTGVAGDLVTSYGHVTLTGTATDDHLVTSVHIFDGATDLGAAVLDGTTWSFAIALGEGSHELRAVAYDAAGNSAETAPAPTILVDTTAPAIAVTAETLETDTGASDSDFITRDGTVTLSGTMADANGVNSVMIYDGATALGLAVLDNGSWSLTVVLGEGDHQLRAVASDLAGNTADAAAPHEIVVDVTPPDLTLGSFALENDTGQYGDDFITTDGTLAMGGSVADLVGVAEVHVYDNGVDIGLASVVDGTWEFQTVLGLGLHSLSVEAVDIAGNANSLASEQEILVAAIDPIIGVEGEHQLTGSVGDDFLLGIEDTLVMLGRKGDDVLGFLRGTGPGHHIAVGGLGNDTIDLSLLDGPADIDLAHRKAGGSLGHVTLVSIENVVGTRGDDVIQASFAVNTLTGGGGSDRFVFASLPAARNGASFDAARRDVITDFHAAFLDTAEHDLIDLSAMRPVSRGQGSDFTFLEGAWDGTGTGFTEAGQVLFYYTVDAGGVEHTIVAGNLDRAGHGNGLAADFELDLIGHIELSAADFVL